MTLNTQTSRTQPDIDLGDLGAAAMPSERSNFIADAVSAVKDRSQKAAQVGVLAAAGLGFSAASEKAEAQLMFSPNHQQHLDKGIDLTQNGLLLQGKMIVPGQGEFARTATPVVVLNSLGQPESYVLMAKHAYEPAMGLYPGITFQFSPETNFQNFGSSEVLDGTLLGSHPFLDVGLFRLNGNFSNHAAPTTFGSYVTNQIVVAGGSGSWAFVGDSGMNPMGIAHGWTMKTLANTNPHYRLLEFGASTGDLPGKGLNGSSGGPVYRIDEFGNAIHLGLLKSQSGGLGGIGTNDTLQFSHPDFQNWFYATIPSPGTLGLLGLGLAGASFRRRRN